jgi:hypothetical protein
MCISIPHAVSAACHKNHQGQTRFQLVPQYGNDKSLGMEPVLLAAVSFGLKTRHHYVGLENLAIGRFKTLFYNKY